MIRSFNAHDPTWQKCQRARLAATREGLTQRLSVLKEGGRAGREQPRGSRAASRCESAQKKLDDARADLDELQEQRAEALARQGSAASGKSAAGREVLSARAGALQQRSPA